MSNHPIVGFESTDTPTARNSCTGEINSLQRAIEASQARVKELEAALEPFAALWSKNCQRYIIAKSNWHNEMPNHWPVDISTRVADMRRAAELLELK